VKRTGQWDTYQETLTCYNKEIRKAKQSSWRRYCQKISDVPGSARLMKIMVKPTGLALLSYLMASVLKLEKGH
jgi:hypothetical protein